MNFTSRCLFVVGALASFATSSASASNTDELVQRIPDSINNSASHTSNGLLRKRRVKSVKCEGKGGKGGKGGSSKSAKSACDTSSPTSSPTSTPTASPTPVPVPATATPTASTTPVPVPATAAPTPVPTPVPVPPGPDPRGRCINIDCSADTTGEGYQECLDDGQYCVCENTRINDVDDVYPIQKDVTLGTKCCPFGPRNVLLQLVGVPCP